MAIFLLIVAVVVFVWIARKRKVPKLADVCMITGGVKTGKSTLALYLARKKYKSNVFKWRFRCLFAKIRRKPLPEKPLFYSNIPLKFEHVLLTNDVFLRGVRIRYKSVLYVGEASLIADSQDWKDKNINEKLKWFNKLYGHESQGGSLFYDTQTMRDVHYSIKRCMNNYLWIHHAIKWIPFVYVVQVREMFYSEDGEMVNVSEKDVEKPLYWIAIPKSIWRKFDCYCYSKFTDHLPVLVDTTVSKELKTDHIINVKEEKK